MFIPDYRVNDLTFSNDTNKYSYVVSIKNQNVLLWSPQQGFFFKSIEVNVTLQSHLLNDKRPIGVIKICIRVANVVAHHEKLFAQ